MEIIIIDDNTAKIFNVKEKCYKLHKKFICACGIVKWIRQRKSREQKYCSKECILYPKAKQIQIECAQCKKTSFRSEVKLKYSKSKLYFCNRKCKIEATRIGGIQEVLPSHYGTVPKRKYHNNETLKCLFCNKNVPNSKYLYCSYNCQWEYRYKEYITRWLNGEETGNQNSGLAISDYVRRYLVEIYGNKCSECNWSKINPVTGKVPLQVDHINGDSFDSKLENLRLLCGACHTLTPTYGALNMGKGRKTLSISRKGK